MGRILAKLGIALVALLILAAGGWYLLATKYAYSSGERAGFVQKFSKKGWFIKTWEGEIAMVNLPGAMTEKFAFTVRDDKVAETISSTMGQRVVLHYDQHRFLPGILFGETEYWVTSAQPIAEEGAAPAPAAAPAAPTKSL